MRYEVQVKVNDVWQLAHSSNEYYHDDGALERAQRLSKQYAQVRIVKNPWLRKSRAVWYTNTEIRANDNG